MSGILVISIALRLAAMTWSILLLHRLRDYRMGVLTAMLALMAARQTMTLVTRVQHISETPALTGAVTELPGLAVSLLALAMVAFLARFLDEQKAASDALENRHHWLNLLLDQMPAHVLWTTDKHMRYTSMRGAGMESLNLVEDDILGRHPKDYFQTEDLSIAPIAAQRRAINGEGSTWTYEWLGRVYEGRTEPLRNERGEIIGAIGLAADVSVQRAAEQALARNEEQRRHTQKLEAMGTLAGGIAHDFNNLLAAISGYTQLAMADMKPEAKELANLQEVLTAARRSEALVEQILTFSRAGDAGAKVVRASEVTGGALRLVRASIPTSIKVRRTLAPRDDHVLISETQLHQVIVNLCTNAVDAMRDSGGELAVSVDRIVLRDEATGYGLEPGDHVRIKVSDTGCGIPEEIRHRIFDAYFTTKDIGAGTGIGLSVVHGIVSAHGGNVRVESEPGAGSTFEVLLPLADSAPTVEAVEAAQELRGSGQRVLFVDDEETLARMGGQFLSVLGYEPTISSSGARALELVRSDPGRFDAVVSDVMMPVMRGEVLAREILRSRPDMPIILCSGYGDADSREKALALGARHFLKKPVSMQALATALRDVLPEAEEGITVKEMARILVIDDEDQIRSMVRQALEQDGHEVVDAADGVAGLELFRSAPADLVITNIFMPEKEGVETIRELKEDFPDLPIVAMSGGAPEKVQASVLNTARAAGASFTLSKPFDLGDLKSTVDAALAGGA